MKPEETQQVRSRSEQTHGCVGSLLSLQLPKVNAQSKHFRIPLRPFKAVFFLHWKRLMLFFLGWFAGECVGEHLLSAGSYSTVLGQS